MDKGKEDQIISALLLLIEMVREKHPNGGGGCSGHAAAPHTVPLDKSYDERRKRENQIAALSAEIARHTCIRCSAIDYSSNPSEYCADCAEHQPSNHDLIWDDNKKVWVREPPKQQLEDKRDELKRLIRKH